LTLSGTNTYTGATTVSAGTLAVTNVAGLGATSAGTTVASGATLDLRNVAIGAEAITLNGGTLATSTGTSSLSGAVTLGASSALNVSGTQLTLSGVVTGNTFGLALLGTGSIVLSNTANALSTMATGSDVGALSVVNGSALTIGQVTTGGTTYSGISSTDTVAVETRSGDLTVSQSVSTTSTSSNTSAPALKLSAGSSTSAGTSTGGNIVLSGSPNFLVGTGGISVFYSGSASSSSGLALANALSSKTTNYVLYNESTSNLPSSGAGYYALFRESSPTRVYLLPVSGQSSTYGTAATTLSYCYSSNASACSYLAVSGIPGATQSFSLAGSAVTSSVSVSSGVTGSLLLSGPAAVASGVAATTNANTYALTLVPSLTLAGYLFSSGNAVNYTVNPKTVSITNTARSTTYDGVSSYATLYSGTTFAISTLLVGADAVASVTQTPAGFAGAASGVAQAGSFTVTPSAAVLSTGTASNYSFSYVAATNTVNKAHLTVTADNQNRFYGAANPSLTQTISGFVNSETLDTSGVSGSSTAYGSTAAGTATNVGTASIVASASGLSASNYDFTTLNNGTLTISAKPVTVTAAALAPTTYNGTTTYAAQAAASSFTTSALAGSDAVSSVTQTASGTGVLQAGNYTVTPSAAALSSGSLGNYSFTYVGSSNTIAQAPLSVVLTGSSSKVCDASTVATLVPGNFVLTGFVNSEGASVSQTTGSLADKSMGSSKAVTASLSSGNFVANSSTLLSNYTLPTTASGNIGAVSPASLTITALTNTKSFDSKTDAQATPNVSGLKGSDSVTNLLEAYADANLGTGKTLSVQTGYQISDGNNGNNYTVTLVPNQTGEIRSQGVAVVIPTLLPALTSNYASPTLTVFAASSSAAPSSGAVGSSSGVIVNTINTSTQQVTGLVAVLVPAGTSTAGTGLVIALPEQVVVSGVAGSSVRVMLPNNEPLPAWIRYDAATQTLITGAVPTGAFPLSVVVTVGGQSTVIQISESTTNL